MLFHGENFKRLQAELSTLTIVVFCTDILSEVRSSFVQDTLNWVKTFSNFFVCEIVRDINSSLKEFSFPANTTSFFIT
jgi:hypothetical protein